MNFIKNPKSVSPYFTSFTDLWGIVKNNGGGVDGDTFCYSFFYKAPPEQKLNSFSLAFVKPSMDEEVNCEFDLDYIKARCYDEAQNLPYKMEEEIIHQALHFSAALEYQYNAKELAVWLRTIAIKELKNLPY